MMTEREIDDLAGRVAALEPEQTEAFEKAVAGIRAEHAKAEEARIAGLRDMADEVVVDFVVRDANFDSMVALQVLRDAGFVRHVTLEAAYREGYEVGALDIHTGPGVPDIYRPDDDDFTLRRDLWLDTQAKGSRS